MDELRLVLSTPPQDLAGPGRNAVAIAHASLEALRDKGDPRFLFLRSIIEICGLALQQQSQPQAQQLLSEHTELLFHCITGFRHVLLVRWEAFHDQFRRLVRDYLMALGSCSYQVTTGPVFNRTIRLALFNASASFWKRKWNESTQYASTSSTVHSVTPEEQSLMESIRAQQQISQQSQSFRIQVITLNEHNEKEDLFRFLDGVMSTACFETTACFEMASSLVGEFAGKSSSQYNMPLEFHKQAHEAFENEGLDRTLQMSMKKLSQVVAMINNDTASHISSPVEKSKEDLALTVILLTIDVIGWEFGSGAWDSGGFPIDKGGALVKPPVAWGSVLIQPQFVSAIFLLHQRVVRNKNQSSSPELGHSIRQLILLLTSLYGDIFPTPEDQKTFAGFLLEGILQLLTISTSAIAEEHTESSESELLDTLSMVSRLIINYKLTILVQLPLMQSLLQRISNLGRYLLQQNLKECQQTRGDIDGMEHREFRDEALVLLVESILLLCGDPWLIYSGSEESRKTAQAALATTLSPLYIEFVTCRTEMAYLEEIYLITNETDVDEVREGIYDVDLEEEMSSLAVVGRLDLQASLSCLSSLFSEIVPKIQSLWDAPITAVSAEAAGVLEQSRLIILYIGHLLTDENAGETRVIPDSILLACQDNQTATDMVASAVQILQQFAEYQASKIAANPSDQRLSPLLAKSFLWFFNRWAPSYILPPVYGSSTTSSTITQTWSIEEHAQKCISFLITLTLLHNCYWPQEGQVQDNAAILITSLAKRSSKIRTVMVASHSFRQLVMYYCLTCGIRHSASMKELDVTVRNRASKYTGMNIDLNMIRGFHRLPYERKGKLLTGMLLACGEKENETSSALLDNCLMATRDAFSSLVIALSSNKIKPDSVDAKEMACLCIYLFDGVALAGDMVGSERIPKYVSPQLLHLSGLMEFYADDLSVCESLLRFFRNYSYQFISILDTPSCLTLFHASSNLLKSYSANHCSSNRVISKSSIEEDEEEQKKYSDVLCAIELLVQLGSKDFFYSGEQSVDSAQVSEMIFVGLQQILPLMNRGLLQYPLLCSKFLQLVGFMLDSYADQLNVLPYDLFDALLESLLYGMTYHDADIAKSSLQGIQGIAREHIRSRVLDVHIAATPPNHEGLIDKCVRRLLTEVVFQTIIWDRLERAGMVLLPLAAIDINRFGVVIHGISQQINPVHRERLITSFESLIKTDVVAKIITSKGHEGRKNRILFKKDFESFCHEIHSFLLVK